MFATKLGYIFVTATFLFALIQLGAVYGATVITNANLGFIPPTAAPGVLELIVFVLNNFLVFLNLMQINSSFFLVGSIILPAMILGYLVVAIELIGEIIP